MTQDSYQAKLYPNPTTTPKGSGGFGVCVSGGGSRALSCALGQLSALNTLKDPANAKQSLLDRAAYLSSVSGGTWASVAYTFLPETIDGKAVSDSDFLITPTPPKQLTKGSESEPTAGNIAYMGPHCLGSAPQGFSIEQIAEILITFWKWGMFSHSEKMHWFWIAAVGEICLRPFGLFEAKYDKEKAFIEPSRSFSLSEAYIQQSITPDNPTLTPDRFHTCRAGRPTLIVNTNLLFDDAPGDAPQVPVQALARHTDVRGRSPDGKLIGGGGVESFAFTSTLSGAGKEAGTAAVATERNYALCDITGCSSAFFAAELLNFITREIDQVVEKIAGRLPEAVIKELEGKIESLLDKEAEHIIPRYNYWPLTSPLTSLDQPDNTPTLFSDGGNFENTGLLGMLAQSDADRILVFVNSMTPMYRSPKSGMVIVDAQLPRLFGFRGADASGNYLSYGGMKASEPMSYVQLFESGSFTELLDGLYDASCGGPGRDQNLGEHPAAFTQTLTTVENPVADIRGGRKVKVLWVYNNRVNAWQDAIEDPAIQALLKEGQSEQHHSGAPKHDDELKQQAALELTPKALRNFPYYSTGQVDLSRQDVNMLAQLSAWNVEQLEGAIAKLLA